MPSLELTIVVPDTGATYAARFDDKESAERAIAAIAGSHSGDTVRAVLTSITFPTLDSEGVLMAGSCAVYRYSGNADGLPLIKWSRRPYTLT